MPPQQIIIVLPTPKRQPQIQRESQSIPQSTHKTIIIGDNSSNSIPRPKTRNQILRESKQRVQDKQKKNGV